MNRGISYLSTQSLMEISPSVTHNNTIQPHMKHYTNELLNSKAIDNISQPTIIHNGCEIWYNEGKKHRVNGPAEIWPDGSEFWFINGQRHREDGPAEINKRIPCIAWYSHDKLHRSDDKPACIIDGTTFRWYVHGVIHRDDDKPSIVTADGQFWYVNGILHRCGNPAIIKANGDRYWYNYDLLHRLDGPAIEHENRYFISGVEQYNMYSRS